MRTYLTSPVRTRIWGYMLIDSAMVAFVFLLSYSFRIVFIENNSLLIMPERVSWIILPGILMHLVCFYVFGLYYLSGNQNKILLFINVVFCVAAASIGVSLFSYAFPGQKVGRILNTIHVVVMVFAVYYSRLVYSKKALVPDQKKTDNYRVEPFGGEIGRIDEQCFVGIQSCRCDISEK